MISHSSEGKHSSFLVVSLFGDIDHGRDGHVHAAVVWAECFNAILIRLSSASNWLGSSWSRGSAIRTTGICTSGVSTSGVSSSSISTRGVSTSGISICSVCSSGRCIISVVRYGGGSGTISVGVGWLGGISCVDSSSSWYHSVGGISSGRCDVSSSIRCCNG